MRHCLLIALLLVITTACGDSGLDVRFGTDTGSRDDVSSPNGVTTDMGVTPRPDMPSTADPDMAASDVAPGDDVTTPPV